MLQTILVPLDGSTLAEHALAYAERVAKATSARMLLSRVVPLDIIEQPEADLERAEKARSYLKTTASRVAERGLTVNTICQWGDPPACLLDQVQTHQVDLIVMGTHGRSAPGRWLYGSVADRVLRASPVPVMLVAPAATAAWKTGLPKRIAVPLDGSDLAEAALAPAVELAQALRSEIVLLNVVALPTNLLFDDGAAMAAFQTEKELSDGEQYLISIAARVSASGVHARSRSELGQPVVSITEIAAQEKAGLIVMATHGRSGLARLVLGSVATGTLQRTTVPLLLLGPAALKTTGDSVAAEAVMTAATG